MATPKRIISKTPADVGNPQANWDRKKFDDTIFDKGYKCYIERAMKCPCSHEDTHGQANSDCNNCLGTGWFFIERVESVLLCTAMSNRSRVEQWSETNSGIVNITARAQDKLGFMDKVTLIELESWFTQVVSLSRSLSQPTKMFSFLIYNPIRAFDVFLFIDSQTPLVPIDDSKYVVQDNKIVLDYDFVQQFGQKERPRLSIRYTHNPTYHIIDINRDLIKQKSGVNCNGEQEQENFPLNCVGRRAHYMMDNPNYNGDGVFDNTNYDKVNKYDL